jgi:FkbM family methyltransferase
MLAEKYEADIRALQKQLSRMEEILEKSLHVVSRHFETYAHRSSRPYYPLNNGWGLTHLNTGQPFFVNTEDRNITPWIIMGGHWEPNVDRVLSAYAQPGMTILDIGAHFGYYTVKLGTKVGRAGKLLAFEPNPEVNAVCAENIKINGLSFHASLSKFALGDVEHVATLTRSASNMASANLLGEQDNDYSVQVQVRRLDNVVDASVSADLIKLDAEGYEKRILDGATNLLKRSPQCAIMIELGLERWERYATLEQLIPACGGGDRELYAVCPDGTIEYFPLEKVRPFLLGCDYHENYFLVARPIDVEARIGDLVKR